MSNRDYLIFVALGVMLIVAVHWRESQGYTDDDAARDAANPVVVVATSAPVPHDSDAVKEREQQYFMDHASLTGIVSEYDDCTLKVTVDGNAWDSFSSQDRTLQQRGMYGRWMEAYYRSHPNPHHDGCHGYLSMYVYDLAGKQLAVYN